MRRRLSVLLVLLLMVVGLQAEPTFVSLSATQTVGSTTFARHTKSVILISDGADTCYFRLFTDVDTAGNATTSSAPIKSGEYFRNEIYPECSGANAATCRDSESFVGGRRATMYSSMSYICGTGDSATLRVYAK